MIELLEINEFELKKYVEAAYEGDADLLTQYHVDTFTFDQAVETTLDMIELTNVDNPMTYYGVVDKERIGYLCTSKNNLYSFGINIKSRTREVLSEFWEKIKQVLGDSFICMLYENNTRAINWAIKCGMVIVPDIEDNCVTLLYDSKILNSCQL